MTELELHWSLHADYPLLVALQLLPLAAAAVMALLRGSPWLPPAALALAAAQVVLAFALQAGHDPAIPALQFAQWIPLPGPLDYHVAVDDAAVRLLLLAALGGLAGVTWGLLRRPRPAWRAALATFALQALVVAACTARNPAWPALLAAALLALAGALQTSATRR